MPRTIYVVEDEPSIGAILRDYLLKAGYAVELFENGRLALEAFRSQPPPSLFILDLMLPEVDGITVCKEVRKTSEVPIIMLTAMVEEIDRLIGLEMGADDYICKPFSPREVVARVKAALRRWPEQAAYESTAPELQHDDSSATYSMGGDRLLLTNTEYRLLRLLQGTPGRVYSRAQLLDLCYDLEQDVSDRAIDSHIKNLRRKLNLSKSGKEYVHSVYGVGYRFEA